MFKATLEIVLKGAKESGKLAEQLAGALKRAKAGADELQRTSLGTIERQTRSATSATESYAQRLKRAQLEMRALGEAAAGAARVSLKPLSDQLDEVEQKAKRASDTLSGKLANRFSGAIGGLVGGLGSTFGGVVGGSGGAAIGAASNAVGGVLATGLGAASFGTLATALGAIGVAAGAAGLAVSNFTKTVEQQADRFKALQQTLTATAGFTAAASRSQIEAELNNLQVQRKQIEAQRAEIQRQIAAINEINERTGRDNPFNLLLRGVTDLVAKGEIGKLNDSLNQLNSAAQQNEAAQRRLAKSLEDGTIAANNAARLEQVLQQTRLALNVQAERTTVQLAQDLARAQREGGAKAIQARLDSLRDEEQAIRAGLERLNRIPRGQLRDDEIQLIAQFTARLNELQQTISNTERDILPAAQARDREIEAMERQRRVQDALTKQRERDLQQALQIAGQLKQLDAAFQERQRLRAEEAAIQRRRDAEAAEFRERIERAKEAERVAAVQARIADIERDTAKRIADARNKAIQDNLKAERKFNEQKARLERDFMRSELDALNKFRLSEARRTEDYYRERNRRLEDLQAQLTDLAAEGDVAGFIAAQRAGERDLRRASEDFDLAGRRASENFLREREEARRAFEERLADLRNNYATERAERQRALAEQIADIKRASQERIAQERELLVKRITESQRIEQEFAARRLQWQAEDQARRERLEREGYEKQRALLVAQQKRLAPVVQQVFRPVEQALVQVGQTAQRVFSLLSGGRPTIGGRIVANATGGIYTSPTVSLLGERRGFGDIVLPFKQSEGIENALNRFSAKAGSKSVVVNIGQIGGDPQFIRAELDKLGSRIIEALMSD